MKTVAHYIDSFLPVTENWIYSQIANLSSYKPVVYSIRTENREAYSFKNVISLQDDLNGLSILLNKAWNRLFRVYPYFYRCMKGNTPDLIHAHFGPGGCEMLRLKEKLSVPLVTTFYGMDVSKLPRLKVWREKYNNLFKKGDFFLVEGSHMKKCLAGLGCLEDKIIVQHLGVNLDKFEFKPRAAGEDKKIRILSAARFQEKKGLKYALKAFALAKKEHKNIEFRLIGDGSMRKEIEGLIDSLKISDAVKLLGNQPYDVYLKELVSSHIFMLPSVTASDGDTEGGAPVALIEAQATGMPVLSTFHADIPEVVINGESGFLVPERDEKALAERLKYLLNNPGIWAGMGKAGRMHVEREYNLKVQIRRLEEVYRRATG